MSLLEKLNQKKTEKIQREKETEKNGKLQNMEQINAEIAATQAKKQRISALKEALQNNYSGAKQKLEYFKTKKETLKNAYEENKDILEEDNIENFAEMLEANSEEPEVKQYRKTGGRGPSKEAGPVTISGEDAGATGELYQAIGTLAEMKKTLQAEMPEVKLNFSAVTREDEKISNRENSFIQIDEYLKTLDNQTAELNKQQAEIYLQTPEGKREALLKIDNPKNTVSSVDFHKLDNFYFKENVLELSEKIGADTIKEEYGYELRDKLWLIAWQKKSLNQRDYYNNKSPEQLAIEAYPALKKLNELSYNNDDLQKFNELHNETLNHLEKILAENEKIENRLTNYGLMNGRGSDYEKKQNDGWGDRRILAEHYLKHATSMSNLDNYDDLIKNLESSQKKAAQKNFSSDRNGSIYSPEYIHAKFAQYSKFLEYIKNNTDANTEFVGNPGQKTDLISQMDSDKELRQKIGLEDKLPPANLEIPEEFINRNGGFYEAISRAGGINREWQTEKNGLAEIATTAVNSRFAQEWERYFSRKNASLLEEVDYKNKLTEQIKYTSDYLKQSGLLNNPEFANRKVKLKNPQGSYNDSILEDVSADEEYKKFHEIYSATRAEIEKYANAKKEEIEKAIGSLQRQIVAFGRSGKLETLNKKWQVFEDFRNEKLLNDKRLEETGISEEDIAKMKGLHEKKNNNDAEYKKLDIIRLNFLKASERKISLNLKPKDILIGQETTLAELPNLLAARVTEIKAEKANLSESELAIIAERDRAVAEVKITVDKFQRTVIDNADVLRKYKS